ncbi:PBS lyase HEAT domain protein repeat-containing protein [Desulfurobacterium thermolithotrophum DSM 11699]|uniref:PBS lyase HEAT domain protein repeat-containing protein n=1 Tax=Desulfurobacterium thermolithotrophum (strain DSM 11699 / BSA) TaxID=868864 RepID=F0S2S9_DESTD|nr:HEAT repeat domain-containing protein [Desulfurobacterium thermolithotrophum]ADY73151.1 PBS lyase HEAT domain protein repeat-containing protein [Desulfurobacterium thermolithotrophum DSM 11699]
MRLKKLIYFLFLSISPIVANANSANELKIFKLNDPDPAVRKAAVFYLSQTGDPAYIPKFCEMLLKDKNEEVRAAAADGLGNFDDKRAEDCLLKALKKEKSERVKESIVSALVDFDDKKVGKLMCKLVDSKNPNIKRYALMALLQYKGLCDKKIFKLLKQENKSDLRTKFAEILGIHQYKPAKNYMMKLLNSRKDEDKLVALTYFKYYPTGDIVPKLEKILTKSTNEDLKSLAFDALIATDHQNAYKLIKKLLIKPTFKKKFALRLATIKTNLPPSVINSLIDDSDDITKIALLTYIGKHKLTNYCNFIEKNVYSKSNDVQAAAIWALGQVDCKDSVKILYELITNLELDDTIRKNAAIALANLNPKELKKNVKLIKKAYDNEIFDDIKDILKRALKKAQQEN